MKYCRWQYKAATATSCCCHEVFRKRNMKQSAHPHVAKPRSMVEDCFIREASSCAVRRASLKKARSRVLFSGAGGGGRTRTVSPPRDFESRTSASSITPAYRSIEL